MISRKIIFLFVITAILAISYSILTEDHELLRKIGGITLGVGLLIVLYTIGQKTNSNNDDNTFLVLWWFFLHNDEDNNNND